MELFVHFIYLYKYSTCDMIEKIKKEVQQLAEEKTGGTPATKAKNKYNAKAYDQTLCGKSLAFAVKPKRGRFFLSA